jgi:hypothetical protein
MSLRISRGVLGAAAFLTAAGGLAAVPVEAQRVPCPKVLSAINRAERGGITHRGDPVRIGQQLDASPLWVEKCASIYGRRLSRAAPGAEKRLSQEEGWESRERRELSREELEVRGDVLVDPAPYRDKARQRSFNEFAEDWEVSERGWRPDYGDEWSPYIVDTQREPEYEVPGLNKQ